MELPERVVDYLQAEFLSETRPFCFQIDSKFRLIESWGDGDWCGLAGAGPAADMRNHAPFLVGISFDETQTLDFVEMPDQSVANLHVIPHGDGCYVVLLDAGGGNLR